MFYTLDDQVAVAEQIAPEDVAAAKAAGIARIVNNRPEGEAPDQPAGDAIRAAAAAAGLDYVALPVRPGNFDGELVAAMAAALDDGAKTLAYCRSGTRSTILWSMARAMRGADPATLVEQAGAAGYDLAMYVPAMAAMARLGKAGG